MATKLIELSDGILVEVNVLDDQAQPIAGGFAEKIGVSMEKIKPVLLAICQPVVAAWGEISREMDVEKATIDLGLSFEAEGNIYITKSKASANLTISLELKPKMPKP